MNPIGPKGSAKLLPSHFADIKEFMQENPRFTQGRTIEELDPKEALEAYLTWNGIQGYTTHIIDIMEELGWKLIQDKTNSQPPVVVRWARLEHMKKRKLEQGGEK